MGWIEDHFHQGTDVSDKQEKQFGDAARQRWRLLGEELKADVAEFNSRHNIAQFSQPWPDQFRVTNAASGLQLTIVADFDGHIVKYEYVQIDEKSAGVPEGGMLSMRPSRHGEVEFYSADERLTSEETREVLLEPVLFPPEMAA